MEMTMKNKVIRLSQLGRNYRLIGKIADNRITIPDIAILKDNGLISDGWTPSQTIDTMIGKIMKIAKLEEDEIDIILKCPYKNATKQRIKA